MTRVVTSRDAEAGSTVVAGQPGRGGGAGGAIRFIEVECVSADWLS